MASEKEFSFNISNQITEIENALKVGPTDTLKN